MGQAYSHRGIPMLHGVPRVTPALDSATDAVGGELHTRSIQSIMKTASSIERVISLESLRLARKLNKVIAQDKCNTFTMSNVRYENIQN